jgi:site-specific DNA-methyltransferase (adenine-specific)
MPDNFIDLTVTSPPYGNMRDYNGYEFKFELIALELARVTKRGGVIVWVVGDETRNGSESLSSFKQAIYFVESCGLRLHDTMIYEKSNFSNPSHTRYHQIFEYMFIFSKGKPKTFNPIKDKKNLYAGETCWGKENVHRTKNGDFEKRKKNVYGEFGMRLNIWRYVTGKANGDDELAFKHPAIFPEKLARDHIVSWTNRGDLVYDPFAGSGTVAKMAAVTQRDFIGSEISSEYKELANERIKPHLKQIPMFSYKIQG